jgi:hypothetical protein
MVKRSGRAVPRRRRTPKEEAQKQYSVQKKPRRSPAKPKPKQKKPWAASGFLFV